jgi:hypothetical protein
MHNTVGHCASSHTCWLMIMLAVASEVVAVGKEGGWVGQHAT